MVPSVPSGWNRLPESVIVVCGATAMECSAWGNPEEDVVVRETGVGAIATLADLLAIRNTPACLVQIGIAGAYPDTSLQIGDTVLVNTDRFVDLGMELPGSPGFLPLGDTPFGNDTSGIFRLEVPERVAANTPVVAAGTVSTCTGTDGTGMRRRDLFGVQIETMEGAAAALAASRFGCPMVQVRAISNRAGDRSIDAAGISRALTSLTGWLRLHKSELLDTVRLGGSGHG